jgi:hypothetical protein
MLLLIVVIFQLIVLICHSIVDISHVAPPIAVCNVLISELILLTAVATAQFCIAFCELVLNDESIVGLFFM